MQVASCKKNIIATRVYGFTKGTRVDQMRPVPLPATTRTRDPRGLPVPVLCPSRAGRSTLPLAEYSYIASSSGTRRVELKPELLPELQEQDMSEVLGEHVCRIFLALDIEDLHFTSGDLLSDVVIPNVDVFRSTILNRV